MVGLSVIETPEDAQRAADHHARLTALMLAAGGVAGPGSVGSFDVDSDAAAGGEP